MRRLAVLLLLVPLAAAFSSLPPTTSPHDAITEEAAAAVSWPDGGMPALQEAVRAPDVEEFRPEGDAEDGTRIDATDAFRPEHHCDRIPPAENASAFEATTAYIAQQAQEAASSAQADMKNAVQALGRALHAAQDCFSHSNYVDLDQPGQEAFLAAVLHGGTGPAGVVLTGFRPHTDETTDPEDPYPHDTYAKDGPEFNEESQAMIGGRTKYEIAHAGAVQGSAAMIAEFLGPLNETQRGEVAALRASDTVGEPAPAPIWPAALAVAIVVALVLVTRR